MNNERAKLSPAMIHALEVTGLDDMMVGGPTRAALMRRGLVFKREDSGRFGYFTEAGRVLAAELQDEKERGHWSERAAEAEQEMDEEADMITPETARKMIPTALEHIDDLDAASRAVDREREIRIGMARTGEGREIVAEFLDAQAAMDDEAILDLTDGQPTTLVDALTRYLEELEGREELQPRARVAGELAAILAYPWPEDERRVQLHNPHYGLALHFEYPDDLETVQVQMGGNRWTIGEFPRNRETTGLVEAVAEAVYRATLARVIPDRNHDVRLSGAEVRDLCQWLVQPYGSTRIGDRLTVETYGHGAIIRTRPYSHQSIPRNDG